MKISDIKIKKDERDSMKEYIEPREMPMPKEKIKREGFFDKQRKVVDKRRQIKLKKLQKEQEYLKKKYGSKLETQRIKTEISELKRKQRESSPLRHIPGALSKVFTKVRSTREREQAVSAQSRAIRTERQMSRQQLEQEREYHRKYSVRPEGDGELPYYETDYKKELPKREAVNKAPVIGITNGERVPKKKTFRDELI